MLFWGCVWVRIRVRGNRVRVEDALEMDKANGSLTPSPHGGENLPSPEKALRLWSIVFLHQSFDEAEDKDNKGRLEDER